MDPDAVSGGKWGRSRDGVLDGAVIVEEEGTFECEFGMSHCNEWGLCCIVVRE